jgi:OOP family OmpA-OmpF porin
LANAVQLTAERHFLFRRLFLRTPPFAAIINVWPDRILFSVRRPSCVRVPRRRKSAIRPNFVIETVAKKSGTTNLYSALRCHTDPVRGRKGALITDINQGNFLKKALFAQCAAGLLLCTAAASACASAPTEQGWYLGAAAGRSTLKMTAHPDDETILKKARGSLKLYGGYQLNKHFALETQYVRLDSGTLDLNDDTTARLKVQGVTFSAVGMLPLNDAFSLIGKLGAAQMSAKYGEHSAASTLTVKSSTTTLLVGVGAEYKLTPALALRAEYEHYGKFKLGDTTAKVAADMASIGLRYSF